MDARLDPPAGVRRKASTVIWLKPGRRNHQADIGFGNDISNRQTISLVATSDFSGELEMAPHQRIEGAAVAEFAPASRKPLLFFHTQQCVLFHGRTPSDPCSTIQAGVVSRSAIEHRELDFNGHPPGGLSGCLGFCRNAHREPSPIMVYGFEVDRVPDKAAVRFSKCGADRKYLLAARIYDVRILSPGINPLMVPTWRRT